MDWMFKLANQRNEKKRLKDAAADGARELWTALAAQVHEAQAAYNKLYPEAEAQVRTEYGDGDPQQAVPAPPAPGQAAPAAPPLPQPPVQPFVRRLIPAPGQPDQYTVIKDWVRLQLHAPTTITATYSSGAPTVILAVALATDGHPVLLEASAEVSMDRACEVILKPLLFDDLP